MYTLIYKTFILIGTVYNMNQDSTQSFDRAVLRKEIIQRPGPARKDSVKGKFQGHVL
jgi:hypothetical protein